MTAFVKQHLLVQAYSLFKQDILHSVYTLSFKGQLCPGYNC